MYQKNGIQMLQIVISLTETIFFFQKLSLKTKVLVVAIKL